MFSEVVSKEVRTPRMRLKETSQDTLYHWFNCCKSEASVEEFKRWFPSPVRHGNSAITHELHPNLNLNLSVCSKNYTTHSQDESLGMSYFKHGDAKKQRRNFSKCFFFSFRSFLNKIIQNCLMGNRITVLNFRQIIELHHQQSLIFIIWLCLTGLPWLKIVCHAKHINFWKKNLHKLQFLVFR